MLIGAALYPIVKIKMHKTLANIDKYQSARDEYDKALSLYEAFNGDKRELHKVLSRYNYGQEAMKS